MQADFVFFIIVPHPNVKTFVQDVDCTGFRWHITLAYCNAGDQGNAE